MRNGLFTLLFFTVAGLVSCRKNNADLSFKQYDDQQIQQYISANGLTGMKRDLTGGDTTGIYYQILSQGTGDVVDYPSEVSLVYTLKSFDGQYHKTDSILNHVYNYVGHIAQDTLPTGVQLAIINIMKNKGTRARVLIPSHLAFGVNGFGSGSSTSSTRIKGNQCLDYYINIVDNKLKYNADLERFEGRQDSYDDISVAKYIANNNLTGYTKTASGLYYKVVTQGSGNKIGPQSVVDYLYTEALFNNHVVSSADASSSDGVTATTDLTTEPRKGIVEGLQGLQPGSKVSLIMPSRLAYGDLLYEGAAVPYFSCLHYEISIVSVQ